MIENVWTFSSFRTCGSKAENVSIQDEAESSIARSWMDSSCVLLVVITNACAANAKGRVAAVGQVQ